MFRSTLIAVVATAALMTGMATTAEAKVKIIIGGGSYIGGGGYGYGDDYYADDHYYHDDDTCSWRWVKVVKWNKSHTHKVVKKKKVYDCY